MQTDTTIQAIATKVIANEGEAILALNGFINTHFEQLVQKIVHCTGRLVVTGIGKSAIIAQKIVSTLNSTGTPALFMHAADAIHGDLGMLQQDDIAIIISKSGESPEIKLLVPLIKNFGNLVIGMVGNTQSFLAKQSDFIINTTIQAEACPNNLAPTTSTTAQLVMGDVLAVCLMELKGFKSEHFAKYHPGGALGKKLFTTVADLVHNNEKPRVLSTATFKEIITEISNKRLGATAVVDDNENLIGIITDGDVRRAFEKYDDLKKITAKDIVNTTVKTIMPTAMAVDALALLQQNDIMQLVVVEGTTYLGMIHLHEILKEGII